MTISDGLIEAYIEDFRAKRGRTCVHEGKECRYVRGTFPIVWFGDSQAYAREGNRRIVTVGLNPSSFEFTQQPTSPIALRELPETGAVEFLRGQCDGYFERHPYKWFGDMEQVLQAFDASYHAGRRTNTAIHVDAFSALSTRPSWQNLKKALGGEFGSFTRPDLFFRLVTELEPDVLIFGRDAREEMRRCFKQGMRPARPEWRGKAICCYPFG